MSLFEKFDPRLLQNKSGNNLENSLADSLNKLVEMLEGITEYSANELKALSILQSDRYLAAMLQNFVLNKKHVKRKHAAEILQALKHIAETIAAQANPMNQLGVELKK
jgi:hypothetical protein